MVKVYIIHESDIIRNGILTVLKGNFSWELIACSEFKNISFPENKNIMHIIFLSCHNENIDKLKELNISGTIRTIGIKENNSNCDKQAFNNIIDLNTSAEEIKQVINNFLIIQEKVQNIDAINSDLTPRETEVLKLVAIGKLNKEIADTLFISMHTVISHRKNITEKLGIKSISGLTIYAILNNLIDPNTWDKENYTS